MKLLIILSTVLIFVLGGCTKGTDTPEGALGEYIQKATESSKGKSFYLDRTTGKLFAAIESMDEDEFKSFTKIENISAVNFKILYKNCRASECFLTYEIEYQQKNEENQQFESISKKIAQLNEVDGQWKISDVTNVKSYIDSKTPLNISE